MKTLLNAFHKIPHAFQQLLSHEKIPTLYHTLPAFEALKQKWTECKEDHAECTQIIEKGLQKLEDYSDRIDVVPAYVLAMGISAIHLLYLFCLIFFSCSC